MSINSYQKSLKNSEPCYKNEQERYLKVTHLKKRDSNSQETESKQLQNNKNIFFLLSPQWKEEVKKGTAEEERNGGNELEWE